MAQPETKGDCGMDWPDRKHSVINAGKNSQKCVISVARGPIS